MNDTPISRPARAAFVAVHARCIPVALTLVWALALGACRPRGPAVATTPAPQGGDATAGALGPPQRLRADVDLDGDGVRDELLVRFTGGARCCYRIGARFAGSAQEVWLPFNLDGGYGPGLGSDPSRFDVVEQDGGRAEVVMEIETYDGEPQPLPEEWRRTYGVASHHVLVSFSGRRTTLCNLHDVVPPDPPAE